MTLADLSQALANFLSAVLAPWINANLPEWIANALDGYPIVDYRPALQQIYTIEQGSFEQVLQLENQIIQMLQSMDRNFQPVQLQREPVTLPTTPPPGYGGSTSGDVATAVWTFPLANATPFTTGEAQDTLMGHFYILSNNGHTDNIDGNPGYKVTGHDSETPASFSGPNQPFLDFSTIRPTDASIFAWATRVYPTSPWSHGPNGTVFERDSLNAVLLWYIDLSDLQFRQWQAGFAGSAARVAPVWPGLANVTLGTAVPIVDQQVLAGPLDGVIVHLTSVPASKTSYFFATTEHDWFRIGAITFRDDNGQEEPPQLLGFDHAVYCARQMQRASSALVRLQGAITGTIQPWTIT
jgi:hypothetical protein